MSTFSVLIARLKGLFAGQRQDQDLNGELQAHLEMMVEENRRTGMPEREARHAAHVRFGGITQTEEIYRAATMFAGYIPARRASRVDPTVALRYE